jgi:hypothetical protein
VANFLTLDQFEAMMPRPLTEDEQNVAPNLLTMASNWILDRLPTLPSSDAGGQQVTFEVTRDAILYGPYTRLDSFQNIGAHRTEAGALSDTGIEEFVTLRHARMLGISLKAQPVANFRPSPAFPGSWEAGWRW